MQTSFYIIIILCLSFCDGSINASGKGKIQTYNGNRFTDAKNINQSGVKFFNRNRARPAPPAHDTPASSCSCSKFFSLGNTSIRSTIKYNKKFVWQICKLTLKLFLSPTQEIKNK